MKQNIVVNAVIALLFAGGGFYAGMQYQSTQRSPNSMFQGANGGPRMMVGGPEGNLQRPGDQNSRIGQGGSRMGFRPVSGEIISKDEESITVKLEDGSSKIILTSDKTTVNKAEEASLSDLVVGEEVSVFGQENSDGSVNAQNIQLNPTMQIKIQEEINETN